MAELKSKVLSLFTDNLQQNIKQALLQEVASVCIDLYSERFSIEDENIMASKASSRDTENKTLPLEPLRVVVVGQTIAGKSSLINTLVGEFSAEVDALPTQTEVKTYSCKVDGIEELRLVDLPGLDGNNKTENLILLEMIEADLILWVLKANQSSKQLDSELHIKLNKYYSDPKNQSRKQAKIIGVVNQVDKLKPTSEWSPPYDLTTPSTVKEKTIIAAIKFNKNILTFDQFIPLAIPEDKQHFGVDVIENLIMDSHNEGKNTQLNRQRHEAKGRDTTFKNQSKRLFKGGYTLLKNAI
jgi:predicted GTPase